MSAWIDPIAAKVSPELVAWARTQSDLQTAWSACERVEWLIDLGLALDLDDISRRALVAAAASVILEDPTFLRLRPAAHRIASVWAAHGDATRLDFLGTRRFDDFQNAAAILVLPVLTTTLLLQYYFHVERSWLRLGVPITLPLLYGFAALWGVARRRLTARALATYRFEFAERDVFRPARAIARKASERFQQTLVYLFRKGWDRVASFPTPRLSAS